MTATLCPTMPLAAWLPLQNAAGGFREECSSLEQLVQELFADLERLGGELEAKADELDAGRRHLAERGRQLAEQRKETARLSHQMEQQEAQLTEALTELRELRADLANRPAPAPVPAPAFSEEIESLRQQITQMQVERAVLLERLEAAAKVPPRGDEVVNQPPPVAVLPPEALDSLAEQFNGQFTAQFAQLKEQLQAPREDSPRTAELESLKLERLELEAELELVRARSAELQETVSRQKRELAAQRLEVSEELKELRTLIAEQGELFAQHEPAPASGPSVRHEPAAEKHSPPPAPVHEEPLAKPLDPVVNSVMAQFARLQRDIAQRRKKK